MNKVSRDKEEKEPRSHVVVTVQRRLVTKSARRSYVNGRHAEAMTYPNKQSRDPDRNCDAHPIRRRREVPQVCCVETQDGSLSE